jgi:hypothetical protein
MEVQVRQVLLTGAALAMLSAPAFAQNTAALQTNGAPQNNGTPQNDGASAREPASMAANNTGPVNVRQQLSENLRQAGFTDVRIVPDSFLVQAKDGSGNPVTMFINPDSMAVLTSENGPVGQNGSQTAPSRAGGMFTNVPTQEGLSSNVVGLSVYNAANQDIGKIKDVAFDDNGVKAYIVAVGGVMGVGDRYVAVKPSAIHVSYDANAKKWHASMNTTADQLKSAPEYKYASNQ